MSDLNLFRYYQRLMPFEVGKETKTTLHEIAELLFVSPRHARSLLAQMQQHEWLSWQPKAGRNHRSTLLMNVELSALKETLARERIKSGKYEKALSILDEDEAAFGRLLKTTSGASLQEGQLNIQLTYKRTFERVVPHQLQRSSERFLLRQIYCCLVASDNDGQVKAELAHHWRYDEAKYEWTFYLRPGLTFHNGSPIDADTVVSLFNKLKLLDYYEKDLAHVETITAPNPLKVIFTLNTPDLGFAGLISGVKYGIQPASQVNEANNRLVVGSGPFSVIEHNENRLKLQAFEGYYSCRVLTDQVTIWIVDDEKMENPSLSSNSELVEANTDDGACLHYMSMSDAQTYAANKRSRIEDGCLFALFNHRAKHALSLAQRRYIAELIQPKYLVEIMKSENIVFGSIPAFNLLPTWRPVLRPFGEETKLPKHISIAGYNYTALRRCARAISRQLESTGCKVETVMYSYRELSERARNGTLNETLVVTNINLDDNRHASAFSNFYTHTVLHNTLNQENAVWLDEQLERLRANTQLEDYLEALEPIASTLVSEYWIAPMFHHTQTLRFQGVLEDVALTNWGWPDIRSVWSAD
ncbi:SgrR family transcriptional regulator [Vibrio natriegens]|uniref:Transporter n=1 Tax=Vibrio natriegens NBRC 15636 = ATCC 14048 = DSM 759 TaxID=1219067 RepID=A0AAN0Y631_VIBNA|nr:SgrR family transcriptional regulator [Vibrio natriegens]ALR18718.1 transporter [Vibrio natriegens NBRC 15636 = ATCC 14048 = DSM 759]ANQ14685.1 transporter [Vibrio natriegens NBRC 15636 = ATCC 14048 = DSM 759]EPM39725.1 transporter [Vibrio natriegens NBRC 15636 = ATCC 14048 = DSM 759]MDX6028351.1 SgrR family transcriptional regulator [Vibrio natriegens NBRC 15636 = ATCC 14048 = DSM 759]UUI13318.1 SgrR family transcriptional regulator [Vibrio natriegens]